MWEKLKNIQRKDIVDSWNKLHKNRKVAVVAVFSCILVILYLIGYAGLKKDYVPLFAGMEPGDAGRIVSRLKDKNVPYKLAEEGTSILVLKDDVYDLRLDLANEGLLHGSGLGFELFDQTRLGATDFERRLNYQRALQEELRRTICQMDEVEQARIHLVMPEQTVFIEEAGETTAAVFLKLKPFASLKRDQVTAVVNLVAGSVENLKMEDVSVIDSLGNVLSEDIIAEDSQWMGTELALKQLEIQKVFERELENRVQRVLEKVYGPGNAVVMVTAELDFDAKESTYVTYGSEVVPRSQTVIEESYSGAGADMSGEAGVDSNIPGYFSYYPTGDMEYQRREEVNENEVDELIRREIRAPGKVERISTAVIVNNSEDGVSPLANTAQGESDIGGIVASAIGMDPERGDTLSVQMTSFNTDYADRIQDMMKELEGQEALSKQYQAYGLAGALLLFFLVAGTFIVKRRRKEEDSLEELGEEVLLSSLSQEVKPDILETEIEKSHRQAKEMAEKNPDNIGQLLKTWLVED